MTSRRPNRFAAAPCWSPNAGGGPLGFTAFIDVLAILSGPLFGVGLLLLTDHSLNFINLAAALVYTFTVPYAAIQLTLYYFDLEARDVTES